MAFASVPNTAPYQAEKPRISLTEKNPARSATAARSARMDFSDADRVDDDELNSILWESIKKSDAPVPVRCAPSFQEPGLVGIFRSVILLPSGIVDLLSPQELDAVLAHEMCHLRRHDNLTCAVHMLTQALFWFYPPVWWIGWRLVDERERACDEGVLTAGISPLAYAEGILKVCRFYVQSPLTNASGLSGADLERRMAHIMTGCPRTDCAPEKAAPLAA